MNMYLELNCLMSLEKIENKNILLIDDVYASGETIKEIIKIFKTFEFNYDLEILVFCYRNHVFN